MQTTITQVGPVEYELEINATADDLAPEFNKALREQRTRTPLKGFRVGKVPLSLIKKMYGKALAYAVADKSVQEVYEDLVLNADEYEVLGQPKMTTLDYEMDGDLRAVIKFGVRSEVTLHDLAGQSVDTLVHEVTDDEVDDEMNRLLLGRADLLPVEDAPIEDGDLILFDLQELDAATRTPLIGKRDEDQQIFLDDPRLSESPLMSALKAAALGAQAGQSVFFHFEHDQAHEVHVVGHQHAHHFEATIKEVKRRELPVLDEAFVKELTSDRLDTVEALRDEVHKQLEDSWERRSRDFLEGNIVTRMLALHPVPVPESVIELYIDSFIEDVKQRNQGQLPPGFSAEAFAAANREEAEKQARWMLICDKLIETEELAVTGADIDAFFEQEAEKDGNLEAAQLRQFYEAMGLTDSLEQRLVNRKVHDLLAERFDIVEKDSETVEREQEERQEEARAEAEAVVEAVPEPQAETAPEEE